MKSQLKPLDQQTIVITGASSGIGMATARMAAARGAKLVLAARNETALKSLVDEVKGKGGDAIYAVADVGKSEEVGEVSNAAIRWYGGYDTWVNNAGVTIFGRILDVPIDEQRQLFETNYWGAVYGSIVAAEHLKEKGGAIVNVGSATSDRAVPLQAAYSAAEHAIKGFTDALRMELEADRMPICVALIKPSVISTPFAERAANYLEGAAKNPPPAYAPELVARAILYAAEHRVRDVTVGGAGKAMAVVGSVAPRLSDWIMERLHPRLQQTSRPMAQTSRFAPVARQGRERGARDAYVFERSAYTWAHMHPVATGAAVAIVAAAGAMALGGLSRPAMRRAAPRSRHMAWR
jgi:short-subunit dehydrogenase